MVRVTGLSRPPTGVLVVSNWILRRLARSGKSPGPAGTSACATLFSIGVMVAGALHAQAPVDLTGYWVSVVTEDYRWRMVTPLKGDAASVPINGEGRKIVDG